MTGTARVAGLTEAELQFLRSQPLGRLATVTRDGEPQVKPVGFAVDPETGDVNIDGHGMATSAKWRNVQDTGVAALVVDALVSRSPWTVAGIELRGPAEVVPGSGDRPDLIRVHPTRLVSWGIDTPAARRRDLAPIAPTSTEPA